MKKGKGFQTIRVYNEIKRRIITLEFKPGDVIDEKQIMKELNVGRTPIREAILMLKAQNLVVGTPNKSTYVKELSIIEVRDLSEALMGIEKFITSLAAQRITGELIKELENKEKEIEKAIERKNYWEIEDKNREFHKIIATACNNRNLFTIHENIRNEVSRLSYLAFSKDMENDMSLDLHFKKIKEQHKKIIRALKKRDHEQAGNLAWEHIKLFQKRIMIYMSRYF